MTCQNCGHPEGSHDIGHEGQPHYCVTVGGCPCTAYREPKPAEIVLDDDDMGDATPMTGEAAIQYRPAVDRLTDQERALLYPTTDSKGLEQRVLSIITNRRLTLTNSKDESLESEPAATDLPDAVVEAAAEAICDHPLGRVRQNMAPCLYCHELATAALAAASGPWAEHLDASALAKAWEDGRQAGRYGYAYPENNPYRSKP